MATGTSAKSGATLPQQNVVELSSPVDSKVAGVAVYSHRAEVTRTFSITLALGQNQIEISGLPTLHIQDSLRVEGTGIGTIQNVTLSPMSAPRLGRTDPNILEESDEIKQLRLKKLELKQAIERNDQCMDTLWNYMDILASPGAIPFREVVGTTTEYDTAMEELQKKGNALAEELEVATKALSEKKHALADDGKTTWDGNLANKATIQIIAEAEGAIELSLIYAVSNASWSPRYAIRVDTHSEDKAVSLVYKANITQMTGEDWTDVPLTLETVTPSFDKTLPTLSPWTIGVYKPAQVPIIVQPQVLPSVIYQGATARRRSWSRSRSPRRIGAALPTIVPQVAVVSSLGDVSATFVVPGLTTIPSDGAQHTVTIADLDLEAKLRWVSVPKKDPKTYLSAKLQNASAYALLKGPANVYVDESFIARSTIPAVSPEENFECALGIDPAIRITYHPLSKKLSQSGILSKSKVHNYTRRITIHNTKNTTVEYVKIIDQIPVSEDAAITVKVLSPALQLPKFSSSATAEPVSPSDEIAKSVKVSPGVTAQWNRPEDGDDSITKEKGGHGSESAISDSSAEPVDLTALGKDGKISWLCSIPAQTKVNLTLQWEVSAPANTTIVGL